MVGFTVSLCIGVEVNNIQDNMGETVDVIVLGESCDRTSILLPLNMRRRWRIWLRETWGWSIHVTRRCAGRSFARRPGRTQVRTHHRLTWNECLLLSRYSTLVWIGSGLSFADFVWIRSKPWKEFDPKNPPSFLQTVVKTNDDKPDVYLEPKE